MTYDIKREVGDFDHTCEAETHAFLHVLLHISATDGTSIVNGPFCMLDLKILKNYHFIKLCVPILHNQSRAEKHIHLQGFSAKKYCLS